MVFLVSEDVRKKAVEMYGFLNILLISFKKIMALSGIKVGIKLFIITYGFFFFFLFFLYINFAQSGIRAELPDLC